jgi:hypothetical protein
MDIILGKIADSNNTKYLITSKHLHRLCNDSSLVEFYESYIKIIKANDINKFRFQIVNSCKQMLLRILFLTAIKNNDVDSLILIIDISDKLNYRLDKCVIITGSTMTHNKTTDSIDIAYINNYTDIIKILIEKYSDNNAFIPSVCAFDYAYQQCYFDTLKLFVDAYINDKYIEILDNLLLESGAKLKPQLSNNDLDDIKLYLKDHQL